MWTDTFQQNSQQVLHTHRDYAHWPALTPSLLVLVVGRSSQWTRPSPTPRNWVDLSFCVGAVGRHSGDSPPYWSFPAHDWRPWGSFGPSRSVSTTRVESFISSIHWPYWGPQTICVQCKSRYISLMLVHWGHRVTNWGRLQSRLDLLIRYSNWGQLSSSYFSQASIQVNRAT